MNKLNLNRTGIALGSFFAIAHLIWSIIVLIGLARKFTVWILRMHFISFPISIRPFSFFTAIELIITTAVIGYLVGIIFAFLWNWSHKKQKSE